MTSDQLSLKIAVNALCRMVNWDGRNLAKESLGDPSNYKDNFKVIGAINELNVLTLSMPSDSESDSWFSKFAEAISSLDSIPSRIMDLEDWNDNWSSYLENDRKDLEVKAKVTQGDIASALLKERYEVLINYLEDTMKTADQQLLDELSKFFDNGQ